MRNQIVGSILHGAYGDVYEQAICLKHYKSCHPEIELRLFASTSIRLVSFEALDLSFASSFSLWTHVETFTDIDRFFQFQIYDSELRDDVLSKLSPLCREKFDFETNMLPWDYMKAHRLIPVPERFQLNLSKEGESDLTKVESMNQIPASIWEKPTISFLWRYRMGQGAISSFGQKSKEELVNSYSKLFSQLIEKYDCHLLVCGMNIRTTDANRAVTDNKYSEFGLVLPTPNVTYLQGLSWTLELEIASRATVCCGHASGFTEALWLKRGKDVVLMDAPPHYLLKAAYHRMPLFHLNHPLVFLSSLFARNRRSYRRRIERILTQSRR